MTTLQNRLGGSEAEHPSNETVAETVPAEAHDAPSTLSVTLERAVGWVFALVGLIIGSRLISDNSFLTHFATGELTRELGSVPVADAYSFTASGEAWTVQSWLVSLLYSYVGSIGQGAALRLVNGLIVAAITLVVWNLTSSARPLLARILLMAPLLVVGAAQWTPRPLLIGVLGLAVVLAVLHAGLSPKWLVPVLWIWANSHGSFPLAFVLILTVAVGVLLDEWNADDRVSGQRLQLPAIELRAFGWAFLGLCFAAVNPIGPRLLIFPVELLAKREALANVAEWQPPTFSSPMELSFLALMLGLVPAARAGVRWRLLVPAVAFSVSGLLAVRNVSAAVLVLIVAIAPSLRFRGSLRGHERGMLPVALASTALIVGAFWSVQLFSTGPLELKAYPVAEVDWLEERGLVANEEIRLIQRDYVGNYLEFRFGADANVFVDDRFDFFPQQVLDDHGALLGGGGGDYAEILGRYEPDVILWENDGGLAAWLRESEDWSVAHETDDWLIALPARS